MTVRILIFALLLLALDYYVFQAFRFALRNNGDYWMKGVTWLFWSLSAASMLVLLSTLVVDFQSWPKALRTYAGAMVFILVISKLFILVFLLTDDIVRVMRWGFTRIAQWMAKPENEGIPGEPINRSDFLVRTGLVLGALPFFSLIYGMVKGAYDVQVKKIKLRAPHLPASFDSLRIVQISDLHVGSFVNTNPVQEAVDRINALNPDLIFFTGDLVNNKSEELEPFKKVLSQLKARHGVYSTLGNHDYGDYVKWDSAEEKSRNLDTLIRGHREMGWDILLDEHRHIEIQGERITLIGVQNYSTHLRFPKYGSLPKATRDITYSGFNILLTHDPSHWRSEVLTDFPNIHLTLSGHTHGFQFGVELPYFRWSPVQYVYKEWGGLYSEGHQHLYVNRGLGFLGYPGRVGILPEITVFDLEKG